MVVGRLLLASFMTLVIPAWGTGQELDFLVSPGPLNQAHADLTGLAMCSSCHSTGIGLSAEKCLDCHKELATRIEAKTGYHAQTQGACIECHHDHQGENFPLIHWNPNEFDHNQTGYPLKGLHAQIQECEACHHAPNSPSRQKTKTYFLNNASCAACHEDPHRGQLGEDCERCHSLDNKFEQVVLDHNRTAFPLKGAHRRVDCIKCHPNNQWKGLSFSQCINCHEDPHQPSLGSDCRRCHHSDSWTVTTFDHEQTRYPLRGAHQPVPCADCHINKQFTGMAFESCRDCHSNDPHVGQFEQDCSPCHVVEGFEKTTFDHAESNYPLTGKHGEVLCADCHPVEQGIFLRGFAEAVRYKPLETTCSSCHSDIHLGQFDKLCSSCHTTAGFTRALVFFQHNVDSCYPLLGKHSELSCNECHKPEWAFYPAAVGTATRFRPLSDQCFTCHDNVHDPDWWTTSKSSLATECRECHSLDTFVLDEFDHGRTAFPLEGSHSSLTCGHCHYFARWQDHDFLLFQEISEDCESCHRSPHLKGLEQCTDCHTTMNWRVRAW